VITPLRGLDLGPEAAIIIGMGTSKAYPKIGATLTSPSLTTIPLRVLIASCVLLTAGWTAARDLGHGAGRPGARTLSTAVSVCGTRAGRMSCPSAEPTGSISTLVKHLTLRQKVGQMMMVSFAGTTLDSRAAAMLSQIQPGGITLFGDNFSSPPQLKALDKSLQAHAHIPLIISVDQEGGYVNRVTKGVLQMPSEQEYGQLDQPATVKKDASTEASQLHNLGINMDLAPVVDVATPSSIIGSEARSYGNNAAVDSTLGVAAINGYQSHGLAATAKHVVGLGTTQTNPETQLPVLHLSAKQLATQLSPFRAASKAGVDGMMVTHVIITGVTAPHTPASLSYKVVTKILRDQIGYRGVLMTDSLTMGAVTGLYGIGQACSMAVQAGENILLIAAGGTTNAALLNKAEGAVISKVKAGHISMNAINGSVTRILDLKQHLHISLPAA
jgi:beta-N-acetylhexosaminidase